MDIQNVRLCVVMHKRLDYLQHVPYFINFFLFLSFSLSLLMFSSHASCPVLNQVQHSHSIGNVRSFYIKSGLY
jgi:hypothetical protein